MATRRKRRSPPKKEESLTIKFTNPFSAQTIYSNYARVSTTRTEFMIKFAEILGPDKQKLLVREVATIAATPAFAKALHEMLGRTVKAFEEKAGKPIPISEE